MLGCAHRSLPRPLPLPRPHSRRHPPQLCPFGACSARHACGSFGAWRCGSPPVGRQMHKKGYVGVGGRRVGDSEELWADAVDEGKVLQHVLGGARQQRQDEAEDRRQTCTSSCAVDAPPSFCAELFPITKYIPVATEMSTRTARPRAMVNAAFASSILGPELSALKEEEPLARREQGANKIAKLHEGSSPDEPARVRMSYSYANTSQCIP